MTPSTVYLETTVVGYLTARPSADPIAAARQTLTQAWWDSQRDRYDIYISDVVVIEAGRGDVDRAARRLEFLSHLPRLLPSQDAEQVADRLLRSGIIPSAAADDAAHLAIAITAELDYLLTWNMKHLAHPVVRHRVERFCADEDLVVPMICTPAELLEL